MTPKELQQALSRGRRPVKPETEWSNFVRKRLALSFGPHCRLIKIHGHVGQEVGVADLIGCIKGKAVALELKTPGGRHKVSPAQADFLASWSASGGYARVIDSPDSVEALVKDFGAVQGRLF